MRGGDGIKTQARAAAQKKKRASFKGLYGGIVYRGRIRPREKKRFSQKSPRKTLNVRKEVKEFGGCGKMN